MNSAFNSPIMGTRAYSLQGRGFTGAKEYGNRPRDGRDSETSLSSCLESERKFSKRCWKALRSLLALGVMAAIMSCGNLANTVFAHRLMWVPTKSWKSNAAS